MLLKTILRWLSVPPKAPRGEQLVATVGGIVSIVSITTVSYFFLGVEGSIAIVPAMGAATVLLFCVPHGPLSQPWSLFAGNVVSAAIGVSCAILISNSILASGLAVGLAIGAMHGLRCMHPPGGATALAAVIGGENVTQLGYGFVLVPVFLNCLVIFIVAVLFNSFFPWRKYPLARMKFRSEAIVPEKPMIISREHIAKGIGELGMVVDVSPIQIEQIVEAAQRYRKADVLAHFSFELGGVYTNNRPGSGWEVRKIVDCAAHPDPEKELIIYKTLEGVSSNLSDSCTKQEFAEWAEKKLVAVKAE
ncbi:MAG: HPP family protein [Gammaproteobacteria bacterium]|nr:HPP family protein [Gammaproteobacteria bacterium]